MFKGFFELTRAHPPRAVTAEPLERRVLFTRFGILADMAETSGFDSVAAMVRGWNPDHIVTAGDNNNNDDTDFDGTVGLKFHDYISPYLGSHGAGSTTGNRFWPTVGNHDWDSPDGIEPYTDFFTLPGNERYYNVRLGEVEFFMLDSDTREPDGTSSSSVQAQWLQAALAASTAPWQVVMFHHPAYSSASVPDNTYMRWPFQAWGADVAISGHDHLYERLNVGGMPYFIAGTGGAGLHEFGTIDPNSQFRYDTTHGALRLDASNSALVFQFFNKNGTLIDGLTINAPTPTAPNAPSALGATVVSSSQIRINWTDNASNETGFRVERSTDQTNFSEIAATASNVVTYTDSNRTPGVTYTYRVRAYNDTGNSTYSNTSSATISITPLIAASAGGWKYLANGSNQGSAWRATPFSDSSWAAGTAEFGYGDGGEATVVPFGPNANNKYVTTYFRKSFDLANPASVAALDLRVIRDDGVVVYLNGTEVFRSNMPGGTIGYTTRASRSLAGPEESTWIMATLGTSLLQPGNNVIAVEIHQSDPDSPDLSFNLQLNALTSSPPVPPPSAPSGLSAEALGYNQVRLNWIDTVSGETGFKVERSTNGTTFAEMATVGANVATRTDDTVAGSTQYWYRVRAYNAGGTGNFSAATVTTPAGPALPVPWLGADVGSVGVAGTSSFAGGVFTLEGSGVDIWGTTDGFRYVYQSLSGNGEIIARVTGVENTNSGANAGVMIRESLSAGSPHASVVLTAGNGIGFVRRTGAGSTSSVDTATGGMPYWVRLVRSGNSFTAYRSSNGTTWNQVGPSVTIAMNANALIGLAVSAKNNSTLCTATFDNVSVAASAVAAIATASSTSIATASSITSATTTNTNTKSKWASRFSETLIRATREMWKDAKKEKDRI